MTVLEAARAADARRHIHGQTDLHHHATVTLDADLIRSGASSGEVDPQIEVERMLATANRLAGA